MDASRAWERVKHQPGNREKGTYLIPQILPSHDSHSITQCSKAFIGISWVTLRPQNCLGRVDWCVGALGSSGGDWADLDMVNDIRAHLSGKQGVEHLPEMGNAKGLDRDSLEY